MPFTDQPLPKKRLAMNAETEKRFAHLPILEESDVPFGVIEVRDEDKVIGRFVLFIDGKDYSPEAETLLWRSILPVDDESQEGTPS